MTKIVVCGVAVSINMICQKCNSNESTVQLRKINYYCEKCFLGNINHKFRACIGKSKLFSYQNKVLVCLSGGEGSTALLDLIYNGLSLDNHKKLRLEPLFMHVCDSDFATAKQVIEQCKKYEFNLYIAHLSDYFSTTHNLPKPNTLPKLNLEADNNLNLLKIVPPTALYDLLAKIKRTIYLKYAKLLQCNYIFTAETTATLASNLLSSIALGRGSQVEDDIGFIDNRDDVKLVRPMRDISKEELQNYVEFKQLTVLKSSDMQKNSLHVLIHSFVTDLQENFPSTVSTVCKTADKLGVLANKAGDKRYDRCKMCESTLNTTNGKLTALQATEFSRLVSLKSPSNGNIRDSDERNVQPNQVSMFPYVNKHLCYSCSRTYSEANAFAKYVDKLLQSPI